MNTAIHLNDTPNVKAVTGSLFFHALLGAWVILGVLPKDITPQQIPQAMNVTIVAMPPKEKMVQKPVLSSDDNKPALKKIVQAVKPRIVHPKALPPIQKIVPKILPKILPKIVAQKPQLSTYHKQPFKPVKQFIAKTESTTTPLPASRTPQTKNTQTTSKNSGMVSKPIKTTAPLFDAAYLNNPSPDYPTSAKRRRMEGKVMLRVVVSSQGTAKSVRVTKSSGFDVLDESAKNTVSRWRFVPARKGNQNIEAQIIVPIDFRLG